MIALAIFGVWVLAETDRFVREVQFCLLGVGATVYQALPAQYRAYHVPRSSIPPTKKKNFDLPDATWMRADHCWHTASTSAVAWEVAIWLTLVSDRTNERLKQTLDLDAHLQFS